MRVLILGDFGSVRHKSGGPTALKNICERLINRGFQIKVLSPLKKEEQEYQYGSTYVKYFVIERYKWFSIGDPVFAYEYTRKVLSYLKTDSFKPDLIYYDIAQLPMMFLKNYPSACFFHGSNYRRLSLLNFISPRYVIGNKMTSFFEKYVLKNGGACMFNSNYSKNEVLRDYKQTDKEHYIVTYLGGEYKRFHPELNGEYLRTKYGLSSSDLIGTFVGGFAEHKGQHILVQILPHILKELPNFRLLLVGKDSGTKGMVERLIKKMGLEKYCILTGNIYSDELPELISLSDVYISASLETFGINVIEGMACGKPLVAFNRGSLPELFRDGIDGYLVNSQEKFIDKIVYLLKNRELRKKMGESASEYVRNKFTWDKTVDLVIESFNIAINRFNSKMNKT